MDDAADIARALGRRRSGKGYICRCPVPSHGRGRGDRNPSLSDPRDVLGVLRQRGLIESKVTALRKRIAQRCSVTLHEPDRNALTIWQESEPAGAIVGANRTAWLERQLDDWLDAKIAERDARKAVIDFQREPESRVARNTTDAGNRLPKTLTDRIGG
jgi:hypothetical protein